jgi:hypothetical protein
MSAHVDHEAYLRRALHEAADSLEPRGDGLERIRARLRQPRPAFSARLEAVWAEIIMRAPAWLQDAIYRVGDWLRIAYERFAPAQAPGKHRSRTQSLLRPLAAMAVVMFIVAAGTYVAIETSTAIFPSSSSNAPSGSGPNAGGHSGGPAPGASHESGTQSTAGHGSRPAPSPSCTASPKPGQPTTTASPPASSASPSASPTDSSTSTDTSSPSPSDSSTDSPAASPAASVPPAPPAASPTPTPVLTKPGC